MQMICLDVEGVLLPEIWHEIARVTGITALTKTTRDVADYAELMDYRLDLLRRHEIAFDRLIEIAATIEPLPGAAEFLQQLRARYQVALISDSFYEFLQPLGAKLGHPAIYCHHLLRSGPEAQISWQPRLIDQKPKCVKAFQKLGFEVFAAGDSYNDLGMLAAADHAAFIHAPDSIARGHPHLARCADYEALYDLISQTPWRAAW